MSMCLSLSLSLSLSTLLSNKQERSFWAQQINWNVGSAALPELCHEPISAEPEDTIIESRSPLSPPLLWPCEGALALGFENLKFGIQGFGVWGSRLSVFLIRILRLGSLGFMD